MERPLFFDTIPPDALSVLLLYLSERPHTKHWLRTINENDSIAVLKSHGSLSSVARQLFINIGDLELESRQRRPLRQKTNILSFGPDFDHLRLFSSSFRGLDRNQYPALRVLVLSRFTDPNLLVQVLISCGASLRELNFGDVSLEQGTIRMTARYCDSLEVLGLDYAKYQGTLGSIWRAVGNTLRVARGLIQEGEFVYVARHCTYLEKLHLLTRSKVLFSHKTAELLMALKSLKVLSVTILHYGVVPSTPHKLRSLLDVCPTELHIHAHLLNGDKDFGLIRAIGPRLRALRLGVDSVLFPRAILPSLVNLNELLLRKLTFGADSTAALQSIFGYPMPNLRKLSIIRLEHSKVLSSLAHCVSSLLRFQCCLINPDIRDGDEELPVKSRDFVDFLLANKLLQYVELSFGILRDGKIIRDAMTNQVIDLIPHLKKLTDLREVIIEGDLSMSSRKAEKIREVSSPLRTTRMNLIVNEKQFVLRPVSM